MSKPNIRPVSGQQKPLTKEEMKKKVMQILQQKRESFAINILCNLCAGGVPPTDDLVEKSVAMADKMISKLYPVDQEEK